MREVKKKQEEESNQTSDLGRVQSLAGHVSMIFSAKKCPSVVSQRRSLVGPLPARSSLTNILYMCYLSRRSASRRTQSPLIPRHNAASHENTWHHNATAAISAASRMPVHKITMTRNRQKTVLFCISIHTDYNAHTHTNAHLP